MSSPRTAQDAVSPAPAGACAPDDAGRLFTPRELAATVRIAFSTAPYPGLRPFQRSEADIFFGRERQIDDLLRKLQGARFLAVVGPSGCGKSSLVRAGLFAGLETGYMAAQGSRWRIAEMRPGSRPLRSLAETLTRTTALFPRGTGDLAQASLVEACLRRGPRGLVELLDGSPADDGANLLLLVDQFEEIFRFRREGDADEAEAFVCLLLQAAAASELPVYVVITMRSDFLGDCAVFPGLPEALNESMYLTPRMTREQCREAIQGPAAVFDGEVPDGLVNAVLNELDPEPDQLPVLQHALMRLWTRAGAATQAHGPVLTLEDYDVIGRLQGALSRHADEAFDELSIREQEIARALFTLLTERAPNGLDVRRPVRLAEVVGLTGASVDEVATVVEAFRRGDRSFLTPPAGTPLDPETVLDISHESLIRQWTRLRGWVEVESASAAMYRRLRETAQMWSANEASLLSPLELDRALDWRNRAAPNTVWASRYGSEQDFTRTLEFIQASEQAQKAQLEREARERARDLVRAQRRLIGTIVLLGVTVVALLLAFGRLDGVQKDLGLSRASLQTTAATLQTAEQAIASYAADTVYENRDDYYDASADLRARADYYAGLDTAATADSLFARVSALVRQTHERVLPYAPTTYLYSWTDMRQDRALWSLYADGPPTTRRPYLTTEQVVPQLWFNERLPMRGDLHNQFAVEMECNRYRGNAGFADFPDYPAADSAHVPGEEPDCGLRRGGQFEPRNGKGEVARAMLYFMLRYPGEIGPTDFPPAGIETLLRWNEEYRVTLYERHRNAAIQAAQGNRNPLVDDPALARRINWTLGYRSPPPQSPVPAA